MGDMSNTEYEVLKDHSHSGSDSTYLGVADKTSTYRYILLTIEDLLLLQIYNYVYVSGNYQFRPDARREIYT